jgi:hypothetical protein
MGDVSAVSAVDAHELHVRNALPEHREVEALRLLGERVEARRSVAGLARAKSGWAGAVIAQKNPANVSRAGELPLERLNYR